MSQAEAPPHRRQIAAEAATAQAAAVLADRQIAAARQGIADADHALRRDGPAIAQAQKAALRRQSRTALRLRAENLALHARLGASRMAVVLAAVLWAAVLALLGLGFFVVVIGLAVAAVSLLASLRQSR